MVQERWKVDRDWLQYNPNTKSMRCTLCIKFGHLITVSRGTTSLWQTSGATTLRLGLYSNFPEYVSKRICVFVNIGTVRDHAHSGPHVEAEQLANATDTGDGDLGEKLTFARCRDENHVQVRCRGV